MTEKFQIVSAGSALQSGAKPVTPRNLPQKGGEPMRIVRSGTYDASGFRGEARVTGSTRKGPMHIVLQQRAARVGD